MVVTCCRSKRRLNNTSSLQHQQSHESFRGAVISGLLEEEAVPVLQPYNCKILSLCPPKTGLMGTPDMTIMWRLV